MPKYNKLVRDLIPNIIETSGKKCEYKILDDEEYAVKLEEKLLEECNECINALTYHEFVNEVADILEVIHAICELNDIDMEEIEKTRKKKAGERGSFKDKILLIEVK